MKFTELDLKPEIQKALKKMGYESPTPVQEKTMAPIFEGRDLLATAETGSGKTSACGIPVCNRVDTSNKAIQALVLVPTRELALQYVEELSRIAKFSDVSTFAVYGGFSMSIQQAKLDEGVHVLVATPGRLIDFLYQTDLNFNSVNTLILDEADEMLNMGFLEDISFILSCIRNEHQTLLFSATMPKEIEKIAGAHLKDPLTIQLISDRKMPVSLIHQFKYVNFHSRMGDLISILKEKEVKQAIVFINSRHGGERLYNDLSKQLKNVDYISGAMDQSRRTSIFNKFKKLSIRVMIATDVAGRGLDFAHVTHVINYDFPMSNESYTHRTGRAGRMGRKGLAITMVSDRDLGSFQSLIKEIEIEPKWIGKEPDMSRAKSRPQRGGKKPSGRGGASRGGGRNRG